MRQKPLDDPTTAPAQVVLAAVLQVRDGCCRRCSGSGRASRSAAPGPCRAGRSRPTRRSTARSAASSPRRSTSARSPTSSSSARWSEPDRHPSRRELATAFLGLVPADVDPELPPDTAWHVVDDLPTLAFDHAEIVLAGARAPARQALVHERRLRARARDVHALGAARPLRGRARPRRLGDEPQARAPAPRRARADRRRGASPAAPAAVRPRSTASAAAGSRSRTRSRRCGRPPRRSATAAAPSRRPACACRRRAWPSPCGRASARSRAR